MVGRGKRLVRSLNRFFISECLLRKASDRIDGLNANVSIASSSANVFLGW